MFGGDRRAGAEVYLGIDLGGARTSPAYGFLRIQLASIIASNESEEPRMSADAANVAVPGEGTRWPNYREGDFVIRNYVFRSGETLPELKLHYRTLGTAKRNAAGKIVNGVLLLQGNTGTGANWLRPSLADELFAPGHPLDATEYFMIMQDAIGRGGSSKPSDGLKGKFPHYRYVDMVAATHRLLTEHLGLKHFEALGVPFAVAVNADEV